MAEAVEVAVLNVGIATAGSFADTDLDDHLKVLAINVTGTTHMAKRVVDHMVAKRQRTDHDRLVGLGDHTHAL